MVHTNREDIKEEKVYLNNIPEGFPFVSLQEYDDAVSMVNTVEKKYKVLTSYKIKRDYAAYKALGYLGNPTVGDFDKLVHANQIKNCPITSKDITNAKVIFFLHLAGIRGKKVIHTTKQVDSDYVAIIREFQLLHKYVSLVFYVLFVNGIHFFDYAIQEASFYDFQTHTI